MFNCALQCFVILISGKSIPNNNLQNNRYNFFGSCFNERVLVTLAQWNNLTIEDNVQK